MSEVLMKLRIAAKDAVRRQDVKWLQEALDATLEVARTLDQPRPGPSNYEAMIYFGDRWQRVAGGSKDYCLGFLAAFEGRDGIRPDSVIVVGTYVVWPEDRWSETIDRSGDDAP